MNTRVKFFHLRYRWQHCVDKNNPHGIDCRGGVTVGLQSVSTTPDIKFAIAFCNLNDVFSRKVGRKIVEGRLESGDCWLVENVPPWDDWPTVFEEHVMPKVRKHIAARFPDECRQYVEALS